MYVEYNIYTLDLEFNKTAPCKHNITIFPKPTKTAAFLVQLELKKPQNNAVLE